MSTDERAVGTPPPTRAVFTNYRLVGVALRGRTVRDVVAASPYRGSSQEE
jgi:hypothetical protein